MLKASRGRYTDAQVERCSLLGGPCGKALDEMLFRVGPAFTASDTRERHVNPSDVQDFIEEYADEELWHYSPGRSHRGFEGIRSKEVLQDPVKMGKKLRQYAEELDDWQEFGVNEFA